MRCGLCGYRFAKDKAAVGCQGCRSAKGCSLVRCPNCGYEFPPEPGWLRAIFKTRQGMDSTKRRCSLCDLKAGQAATVVDVDTRNASFWRKIMAMGVFPGTRLTVTQTFPSIVFQLGQSQFAIDKDLARQITVTLSEDKPS